MNIFEKKVKENTPFYPLKAERVETLQVNMGYRCNLSCTHCHVEASPSRREQMSLSTVDTVIRILKENREIRAVDITGGSPEYNPNYKLLVTAASQMGKMVTVRTNLAILAEVGMEDVPGIWEVNRARVIASLPCYTEEGVDVQRGTGTYKKAISVLKNLNSLGYGREGTGLEVDIMFNPAGAAIAPDQDMLEKAYKEKLKEMHGVVFNHLIVLSNMPIGRLKKSMSEDDQRKYLTQLEEKFNPATVRNLMCRHLISVAPDGKLYDCDFWQMIKLPVKNFSSRIEDFNYEKLKNREIVTLPMCLMCTAGAGTSCGGALT